MFAKSFASKASPLVRGIATSAVRCHDTRGIIGSNLPFQIKNRYRLLLVTILFVGSGFSMPFLTLRHMILAKNQQ